MKTFTIPVFFVKLWQYSIYEIDIFSNWQITSYLVVARLYASTDERSPIRGWSVRGSVRFWLAKGIGPKNFRQGKEATFSIQPDDVYFGRRKEILKIRVELKKKTVLERNYYNSKIIETGAEVAL